MLQHVTACITSAQTVNTLLRYETVTGYNPLRRTYKAHHRTKHQGALINSITGVEPANSRGAWQCYQTCLRMEYKAGDVG